MLAPVTEANFGEEDLLRLNLESARRYPSFAEELTDASGVTVGLSTKGTLFVALDRDQREALDRLYEFQVSLGLDVEALDAETLRSLEPSLHPSAVRGVLAVNDRSVDPRVLSAALVRAGEKAGVVLQSRTEVSSLILRNGRCVGVRTSDGSEFFGDAVVLAAGSWSGLVDSIPTEVTHALRPVKGQLIHLRPRAGPGPIEYNVRTEEVYLVPRTDGSVVVGASVEEKGFDVTVTAGEVLDLLRAGEETVPAIREMELSSTIAGLRPGTPDNAPMLGPTSIDGVTAATGHFRNGVLLTPITADTISDLLTGSEVPEVIKAFDPRRFGAGR